MPSLLTHERFREELRLFAKGALRTELRELGERLRKEVSQDLSLTICNATEFATPMVNIVRTDPAGGTTTMVTPSPMRQSPSRPISRMRMDNDAVSVTSPMTPMTPQSDFNTLMRSISKEHAQVGSEFDEDDGGMKNLRSYKVVESNVQTPVPRVRRRSHPNHDSIDTRARPKAQDQTRSRTPPSAAPQPGQLFRGWTNVTNVANFVTGRGKSGDSRPAQSSGGRRSLGKLEAVKGKQFLRARTGDGQAGTLHSLGTINSVGDSQTDAQYAQDAAGQRRPTRSASEEISRKRVMSPELKAPTSMASSKVFPEPNDVVSSTSHSGTAFSGSIVELDRAANRPGSPVKDPRCPAGMAPAFVGITPTPKVSWGEQDLESEVDGGLGLPATGKQAETEQSDTQGWNSGFADAEECEDQPTQSESYLDGQERQMYFQRDHKKTVQFIGEASSRRGSMGSSLEDADRGRCFRFVEGIVEHDSFKHFMALVIFANLFTVGMQTDYLAQNLAESAPIGYSIAEAVFCALFLMEILGRLYVYRRAFFLVDGWKWNVFDCFMVVLQLFEQALELAILSGAMGEGSSSFSFGFLRALRILRVIRLLRAARIVEHVRELQTIVLSIGSSIKSLCWTLILLLLLIYTVGVSFTQLVLNTRLSNPGKFTPDHVFNKSYGSLGSSILTLYGSIMGGVDWVSAAEPLLQEISPLMGVVFSFYVAFAVLAMMNVVTGVFVEASLKTARDHQESILLSSAKNLFKDADLDASGCVSWSEFQERLDHPDMLAFFKSIDVDISEADSVFQLLDFNGLGKIDVDQFMGGCLRLRGPSKAVDLAMLMQETRRIARRHGKQMSAINRKIEAICGTFQLTELSMNMQDTQESDEVSDVRDQAITPI